MTVIGLDDTDSRSLGMCTTYVATRVAKRLVQAGGRVEELLLVRLLPSVEYKTRGNAALAIHTDVAPEVARETLDSTLDLAMTGDDRTNPGALVADCSPGDVSDGVATFAKRAARESCSLSRARTVAAEAGFEAVTRGTGRGLVGALAAIGADRAFDEWTYECITYRDKSVWGTPRDVDKESVFTAAQAAYPTVWDTVDLGECDAVCVPRTPGPVLYGIRGETPTAVCAVADSIESEPVDVRQLFRTNQGTDAHIQDAPLRALLDGRCYRTTARVLERPETREGGHVFVGLGQPDESETESSESILAAAFEPTKRFRDHVRALRPGDTITACGEFTDGTLKLEKFRVRDLVDTERVTPPCPSCERSMESAGRDAGYRCRECGTSAPGRIERSLERDIEAGWYEVPPCARRHIAKPLIRGGFDGATHPER